MYLPILTIALLAAGMVALGMLAVVLLLWAVDRHVMADAAKRTAVARRILGGAR